jgi:hypothetical protein
VAGFGPVDATEVLHGSFSACRCWSCVVHKPEQDARRSLLMRLDGLPCDELFAIPATRTAPVLVRVVALLSAEFGHVGWWRRV